MRKQTLIFAAIALMLPLMLSVSAHSEPIIYTGGLIYVKAGALPVEAVVVQDGKFTYTGSLKDALLTYGSNSRRVDLGERTMAPSFFDAHAHPNLGVVFDLRDLPYQEKIPTPEEYVEHIRQYLRDHPDIQVLRGSGWENAAFHDGPPNKALLDQVSTEIPIFIRSSDQHSAWVNSKTLESSGIGQHTFDPSGGMIEYDDTGQPIGTIRDEATNLVESTLPALSVEENKFLILKFQEMVHRMGITGYMCAMVMPRSNLYTAYRELFEAGKLQTYTQLAFMITPDAYKDTLAWITQEVVHEAPKFGDLLGFRLAKFFMDGTIIGQSAYLLEDYTSRSGYRGTPQWPADMIAMHDAFRLCDKNDIRIHIHAVGDAAVQLALDTLEATTKPNRHAITHLELVEPKDIARFKSMEVIATINPYWFCKSVVWDEVELVQLGTERAEHMLPAKSFYDAGVRVAAASDYPVTAIPNPLIGIEMATTRTLIEPWRGNRSAEACMENANEAISLEQALDAFTLTAAYSYNLEQITGSIEVGKSADFIVLDRNIFEGPPSKANVLETWFRGNLVYQAK